MMTQGRQYSSKSGSISYLGQRLYQDIQQVQPAETSARHKMAYDTFIARKNYFAQNVHDSIEREERLLWEHYSLLSSSLKTMTELLPLES